MLDTQKAKDYYYKYRHQKGGWKGTLYNTAGWTSVEVAGKVIDKIGPILATKYLEFNYNASWKLFSQHYKDYKNILLQVFHLIPRT